MTMIGPITTRPMMKKVRKFLWVTLNARLMTLPAENCMRGSSGAPTCGLRPEPSRTPTSAATSGSLRSPTLPPRTAASSPLLHMGGAVRGPSLRRAEVDLDAVLPHPDLDRLGRHAPLTRALRQPRDLVAAGRKQRPPCTGNRRGSHPDHPGLAARGSQGQAFDAQLPARSQPWSLARRDLQGRCAHGQPQVLLPTPSFDLGAPRLLRHGPQGRAGRERHHRLPTVAFRTRRSVDGGMTHAPFT